MPAPPAPSNERNSVPGSSDHALSQAPPTLSAPRPARDAPAGTAHAQRGHATPAHALPPRAPLTNPLRSPQHPPRAAPGPVPTFYSFDPYAQAAWDWSQSLDFAPLPTPYEPQGELIAEPPARAFVSPLVDPLAPPPRPPPPRAAASPRMKRKVDAQRELESVLNAPDAASATKRQAVSRTSSNTSQSPARGDALPSPAAQAAQMAGAARRTSASKGTGPLGRELDVADPRRVVESSGDADMLPAGRVFPIQIGSALFRLSGASLCSDAPSYFSHFFNEQLQAAGGRAADIRTLYIDRDPETFRDIALHLQGYYVAPRDGEHFVKLFADAQFYSLPRLTKQLFKSDIFIDIGGTPFRIPRDSFSAPGNSPNYFTLGFTQWFSTPSEVFPGLDRAALLRPPSISPPAAPNKSPAVFAELMLMLQGYDVDIKSPAHRANLLRDARYFHLKGLEQQLLPCTKSYNLLRRQHELLIRLEDIRQSGVSFAADAPPPSDLPAAPGRTATRGTVTYARPYTDDATTPSTLVLESSTEATLAPSPADPSSLTVQFTGDTHRRVTALLAIVATKMDIPSALAAPAFRVRLGPDTSLTLDGAERDAHLLRAGQACTVRRAQWRVRVEPAGDAWEAVLEGVKVDLYSTERGRNAERGFLNA